MAYEQCITLVPYLKAVPDTRHARGKQYELWVLLTVLCTALISGQKTVWGIVQWALLHANELISYVELSKQRMPSASTFYVTLRNIGIEGLERHIGEMGTKMEAENRPSQTMPCVSIMGWTSAIGECRCAFRFPCASLVRQSVG